MDNKRPLKFTAALALAKGVNKLINIVDKTRGSNLSGEKALIIDPEMVAHFNNIDPEKVVFITGTNGKSSSTNLVVHILRENGFKVVSNLEGANLLSGLATSLAKESDMRGRLNADFYIFETDERFLPIIYRQLPAKNLLIMNLQKDQVQRNGDPDFIVKKLESLMNHNIRLFLNNNEPRSKAFERFSNDVIYFGVDKNQSSFKKDETYPTEACPYCSHGLEFEYYNVDGVGLFKCPNCGFEALAEPDYLVSEVDLDAKTMQINGVPGEMPYDLPFMLYNYAAAAAVCMELADLSQEDIFSALPSFRNIGGRFETFEFGGKAIKYMRIKQENPDTLQSALNIMAEDSEPKAVFLGLYPIHDFTPGYTNTFYTYDCDYAPLVASGVDSYYCFSPAVCYDTALRLIYEGVPKERITVEETEDPATIFNRINDVDCDNIYLITWLHTFEDLKKYVRDHGGE